MESARDDVFDIVGRGDGEVEWRIHLESRQRGSSNRRRAVFVVPVNVKPGGSVPAEDAQCRRRNPVVVTLKL